FSGGEEGQEAQRPGRARRPRGAHRRAPRATADAAGRPAAEGASTADPSRRTAATAPQRRAAARRPFAPHYARCGAEVAGAGSELDGMAVADPADRRAHRAGDPVHANTTGSG